jgi:Rod binding domain-containing protein
MDAPGIPPLPPTATAVRGLTAHAQAAAPPGGPQTDADLRRVCTEFESLLTAQLLKRAISSAHKAWGGDEGAGSGTSAQYLDMVSSQLARYVGNAGLLGVADDLYAQLKGHTPLRMQDMEKSDGTNAE